MKLPGSLAVALLALAIPLASLADRPGQAAQKRDRVGLAQKNTHCPPGLAKKDAACVPPGQAKKAALVGRVVDWGDVHVVSKPGLYGLADAPDGQHYAIIEGKLVRIEARTAKVLSVIRGVEAILD